MGWSALFSTYWYLAALRIILVLIPQLGYIHPDEYFQSVEVLAGTAFELESNPPWEFNSSFPVRSMTIPYFTTGMLYKCLNLLTDILKQYSIQNVVNPYSIVVAPRILTCLLSFLVDWCLCKICSNNNEKYQSKRIILASSYVIIVFGTRTFSNTIELILFSLLLYYVCDSLVFSNILTKKRDYLNYRYNTSKTIGEKVKFHKLRLFLASDSLRNCFAISTITVFGFFNRPTFLGFALFPIFFWLYRGIDSKSITPMNFHLRILGLIVCSIPSLVIHVLVDSFYYSYLTWGEIGMLDISINNFVFTPLNFLKYNLDSSNLAKHGLHPRFLHILVNMPLLFNILALYGIIKFFDAVYKIVKGQLQLLPTVRSIKGLMMLSYIAPLTMLSFFPHQEPRFIIPLIVPLVYLFGNVILPERDNILIEMENRAKTPPIPAQKYSSLLIKLWFMINVIFVIFFGFLHQGGVYQAANYLHKDLKLKSPFTEYHIVTTHIYSIPETLLLQKSSEKLYFTKNTKYSINKSVFLHEEGSLDTMLLMKVVQNIFKYKSGSKNKKVKVLLIIPSSLDDHLNVVADFGLKIVEIARFYPHLSTEAFPDLGNEFFYFYSNLKVNDMLEHSSNLLSRISDAFGLKLYEIIQINP